MKTIFVFIRETLCALLAVAGLTGIIVLLNAIMVYLIETILHVG